MLKQISRQSGESLIEVMVSLLLFSFALLGLLATQQKLLGQLQATESALQASRFSSDLAEYLGGLPKSVAGRLDGSDNQLMELSCPIDTCDSDWLNTAIDRWQRGLESALPGARLRICRDDTPADGSPELPSCMGLQRLAIKIWPQAQRYPMVAAVDL